MKLPIEHSGPRGLEKPPCEKLPIGAAGPRSRGRSGPVAWLGALLALVWLALGVLPARADIAPPGCSGSGLGISLFADKTTVNPGDTINYSALVFNTPFPACDATAVSAWIVTPDGVTNMISLVRVDLLPSDSDYYSNVVSYVVRPQDVTSNSVLRATAEDIGTIHQNTPTSIGGGFQGVDTLLALPCIQITAQCLGGAGENGAISFTGTITNCGNQNLSSVVVSNVVNGQASVVLGPISLSTNASATFTGSYIPANPCAPSTVLLLVQAVDTLTPEPDTVTASTTATCSETLTPAIGVGVSCPNVPASPGQTLTYSGLVTNMGNVTLTNVVVVSSQPVANTVIFTVASLAPGAVAPFTGSYTAPVACSASAAVTATGTSVCGQEVSAAAGATCQIAIAPQISVTEICPAIAPAPGGKLTYTGVVSNPGNIPLKNIVVTSSLPVPNTVVFTAASLAPGASANFTGSFTAPTGACSVTSSLSASGADICAGNVVNNSVTTICPLSVSPKINVTVACPGGTLTPGGSVTYTGTVSNTGNDTLLTVIVSVPGAIPNTLVLTVPSLAPGASAPFTATLTAPLDACSVTVNVGADGTDACGSVVVSSTASATCPLVTAPMISVSQTCPAGSILPGGLLTYSGTVGNPGNVTLTNVVVLSSQTGSTPVFTAATLAPGAVLPFSGSYTVPASANCSLTTTLTATGNDKCNAQAVSAKATSTCPIGGTPSINLTMVCPVTPPLPGTTLSYTGTVMNNGTVPLTNVVVVGSLPAAGTVVFKIATLAPGASAPFTGSFVAPTNVCSVTTMLSANSGEICAGTVVATSVTTTCVLNTKPSVAVSLACPAGVLTPGSPVTYTGSVVNTGNDTLLNLVLSATAPGTNGVLMIIPTLGPGGVVPFTLAVTAPLDSCSVGAAVVVTGADSCSSIGVTNSASATCPITLSPQISVTENCPATQVSPGGLLTFSGTVANTGNNTLLNVVVLGSQNGATPVFTAATLAPGAVLTFTGSYTIPASANCSISSTLTASAVAQCGSQKVSASATSICPLLVAPGIQVTLTCPATLPAPSGSITYSGVVLNDGNITLTNIVVTSPSVSGTNTVIFTSASLAAGASATFTFTRTVPPNCCTVASEAVATGVEICGGTKVSDSIAITCNVLTSPQLTVTRQCPTNEVATGRVLHFKGTVANTGNITILGVIVVDAMSASNAPVLGPIDLAPGQTVSYTGSYVVPPDFCGLDTVTATGSNLCGGAAVVGTVTTSCPIQTTPQLTVVKICPVAPVPRGGLYVFTGFVTNTGNVTLTNVMVVDDMPTNPTPVLGPVTLAPGAFASFTGSYTAPLCCCVMVDTVTATGQGRCDGAVVSASSTAVCQLLTAPSLAVTKICPVQSVPVGSLLTYSGWVTNTGDITLTNVTVVASQPGGVVSLLGPVDLAPGESQSFGGSYIVTPNDNQTGDTVTASGATICSGAFVTAATANCLGIVPLALQPVIGPLIGADGPVTVQWSSTPGATYALQYKTSLTSTVWITLPGTITATGTTASFTDATASSAQRFYRVMVVQ